MKKLILSFAVAALAFGVMSCSNDEVADNGGPVNIDDFIDSAKSTNSYLTDLTTFSLGKTSDTIYAETSASYTPKCGYKNEVANDYELELSTSDKAVATASFTKYDGKTDASVKVTGVAVGTAVISASVDGTVVATLNVTVKSAEGIIFADLAEKSESATKAKELPASDGKIYLSATDLTYTTTPDFGTVKSATSGNVINGDAGYKISGNADNKAIVSGTKLGTFKTTITAKEACKISKVIYVVGSSSFAVTGKVSITKEGASSPAYETKTSLASSKGYEGYDELSVALNKDETADVEITVYAANTKKADDGINFGIGNLIISASAK